MRLALISDIHANLEAFTAVLDTISKCACDQIICLGDVVGYGPNPNECIALVSEHCHASLKGNHDEAAASDEYPYAFNKAAKEAIVWTREQLGSNEKKWLNNLQLSREDARANFAHACFHFPEKWEYLDNGSVALRNFKHFGQTIGFIGHTHQAIAWVQSSHGVKQDDCDRVHIEPGHRYIINVGSVGQPRDRDPRACFAIWDSGRNYVDYRRVAFDWKKTVKKISAAGLPQSLAERLAPGI